MPARDLSKYEGSTHINLIEQLQNLDLAGKGGLPESHQEIYGNGISDGDHLDADAPDGVCLYTPTQSTVSIY